MLCVPTQGAPHLTHTTPRQWLFIHSRQLNTYLLSTGTVNGPGVHEEARSPEAQESTVGNVTCTFLPLTSHSSKKGGVPIESLSLSLFFPKDYFFI